MFFVDPIPEWIERREDNYRGNHTGNGMADLLWHGCADPAQPSFAS
jgi:hypothetical protein